MKILFLSLNGDPLARAPRNYGGAGKSFRLLVENLENAYIAGEERCFQEDINEKCLPLSQAEIDFIRRTGNLKQIILDNPSLEADLYVYACPDIILNVQKPQICWAVGAQEPINPNIKNLLLHNRKWQKPVIQSFGTKVYEFVLGIEVPPFQEYQKRDQIVQITNHYPQINSILLAEWALKYKIKTIFCGPIAENYPLLDYIDYDTTWYLGQITEAEKIKLMKASKIHASLYQHDINGPNLSTKSALSFGCGILTTRAGIMPEVIKHGTNGFLIQNENDFINAWNLRSTIRQLDCYNISTQWSVEKMVESFKNVVSEVTKGS